MASGDTDPSETVDNFAEGCACARCGAGGPSRLSDVPRLCSFCRIAAGPWWRLATRLREWSYWEQLHVHVWLAERPHLRGLPLPWSRQSCREQGVNDAETLLEIYQQAHNVIIDLTTLRELVWLERHLSAVDYYTLATSDSESSDGEPDSVQVQGLPRQG